ncbi:hypothetical protein GCM10017620_22340 [Brevundimonas intermedia]|uniref:Uncharacterized protein n=1 Tax=Brevundimonas intermedia TaxID=74315 RepID=A0ABQ5TAA8_9CAUL|nr:hypothetical protein GCM10017620_22340 [Brevundimonas intermedia]
MFDKRAGVLLLAFVIPGEGPLGPEPRNPAARVSANLSRTRSSNSLRRMDFAFGAAGFRVFAALRPE